jgi:hypothetical protein
MGMRYALYLCGFLMTATAPAAPSRALNETLIEIGKKGIQENLKDAESARFRELTVHRGETPAEGVYYVCGEVNSKNSYGGYAGFTPFFAQVLYWEKQGAGIPGTAGVITNDMDPGAAAKFYRTMCSN